ncbi:MAG: YfhO family protein [Eubacterium sp.]
MDITKSRNNLFTTKLFNGETVNYTASYFLITLLFLIVKQIFKLGFGISAGISVLVSFILCEALLFLAEKKFVFNKNARAKLPMQIIMFLFRAAVNFGFYKIFAFIFGSLIKISDGFVYLASWAAIFFFNYYFDRLLVFDSTFNPLERKNGKLYRLFFDNRFVVFSIGLATLGIGFVFMIFKLFPFGDMTVMRMDLYHQYGPLFVEYFDRIVEHKSFFYSWESGGGSSFLGNFFNYLSSPISLVVLLFDRKDISYAITTLVIIKGVLSAGTFTYFLKKSLNSHCLASASFGVFYAFCGYFLAYYWNIMWIDGMIWLPLIALGIEQIINNGRPALYIVSLTVLLFSSYYMGYMCCIFSVLYFIVYYFMHSSITDKISPDAKYKNRYSLKAVYNNKFINRGLKFASASVLSAALCACTLIPVYYILQACSATSDSFPATFSSYFDLLNLFSSNLAGLETTIRSSGDDVLPNIYCGTLAVILLPLYFTNKDIKLREKAMYLLLLIFFVFSFDNNFANFIWHAFHFPNDLPYRFSYMYSFIVLIIAYKGLMHIKSVRYSDIAIVGMLWLFMIMLYQKMPTNKISEITIYITIAFTLVWTGVLLLIKKNYAGKVVIGVTIAALTFCEVIVADSQSYLFTQKQADYVDKYDGIVDAVDYTYDSDKDFYRTELCYLNTRMDPCLYGYNGMSAFSSMAYESYSRAQYSLGMFGNRINSYTYNTQTPVYNMMYSIKYLMRGSGEIKPSTNYYTEYYKSADESITVYKNDYFLPIAYQVSGDIENWDTPEGNPFSVQEDFIDRAAGVSDVFVPVEYVGSQTDEIMADSSPTENGTYFFSKLDTDSNFGNIDITVKSSLDSNVYVYITSPAIENVNYYWYDWNNDKQSHYQNISEPYILDLGKHNKGDEITISLDCSSIEETDSYYEIYVYNVDNDVLKSAYELLKIGELDITSYTDTEITGTVDAGFNGYLYTSIPYDEGWSIYIDGEKVDNVQIGGCQLGAEISKGEHSVRLKYTPKGLKYGILISGAAWLFVIAQIIFKRRKPKK